MPSFPVIDTHLHLWDPKWLTYGWLKSVPALNRPFLIEDYAQACGKVEVEAMVFLECEIDRGQFLDEIRFVEKQAAKDRRLKAIVAKAALEDGRREEDFLAEIRAGHPMVRGIRRIIEFEPDMDFCLKPGFIEGVRMLEDFGLHFEINVNYRHMEKVLAFVDRVPGVPMILDHCGKPGVREHLIEPWRSQMKELAERPNVWCKLSDLPVEADHKAWTEADLRPFIDATLDAFGIDRVIYGGDWPVCLQAVSLEHWVAVLDNALAHLSQEELRKIYRDNAVRFYRLDP